MIHAGLRDGDAVTAVVLEAGVAATRAASGRRLCRDMGINRKLGGEATHAISTSQGDVHVVHHAACSCHSLLAVTQSASWALRGVLLSSWVSVGLLQLHARDGWERSGSVPSLCRLHNRLRRRYLASRLFVDSLRGVIGFATGGAASSDDNAKTIQNRYCICY